MSSPLGESEKREGVTFWVPAHVTSFQLGKGAEYQLASWRKHISSRSTTNLSCLQMGFVVFQFNKLKTQCPDMSTNGDMPTDTRQAPEVGKGIGEKGANCWPAGMAPSQEVLRSIMGLWSL